MRRMLAVYVGLILPAGGTRAAGVMAPDRDTGAEVRGVFAARCAGCHGADLPHPKGRFGYVLDLRRVAGNPEMVVPSRPHESELWVLVDRGEMPPPGSPGGPLTAAEKEVVWSWIAAGAPDAVRPPAVADPPPAAPSAGDGAVPPAFRTVNWLGKFHLLLLHFPIALVLSAGLAELGSVRRGSLKPEPAVQFCLALAAVAVVPTAALGWLHAAAGNGTGSTDLLFAHRWLGTAAGVWVVGTALAARRDAVRGRRSWGVRVAIAVGVGLVAGAAHFGGLMTRGSDFFDW